MSAYGKYTFDLKEPYSTAISVAGEKTIIHIHKDGRIEFFGPVDEAANEFLMALGLQIDNRYCSERVANETLYKKLHYMLDRIEGMTKEEMVSYLQELELEAHKSLTWAILNEENYPC